MEKLIITVTIVFLAINVFGQRECGSQLNLSQIQLTDPARYQRIMAFESLMQTRIQRLSIPQTTITNPVVVHVVYNNNAQNISEAQINAQIQVLNQDYRRLNADRTNTPAAFAGVAGDAMIEFKLAKIDPNGNPTSGITRTSTSVSGFTRAANNVKFTSQGGHDAWNTQRYLNIWVCNLANLPDGTKLLGYSSSLDQLVTSPNMDGVVINYISFGVDGHTVAPFNKGRTTTHEVGHWLNLRHIWADVQNCVASDFVDDTPSQYTASRDCPSFPRTDLCTVYSPGIMFMNFMDYSDDACMNMFTNGQIARMRALFDSEIGPRKEMLETASIITNPPTISGPATVCSTNTTPFTLNNADGIPSDSVKWTCSSNLQIYPAGNLTGKSKVFRAITNGNGDAWVRATIFGIQVQKNIMANFPETAVAAPLVTITMSQPYTVTPVTSYPDVTGYSWGWAYSYSNANLYTSGNCNATVSFDQANNVYTLFAHAVNQCGTSSGPSFVYNFYVVSYPVNYSAYPNPASNILNIEIDEEAATLQSATLEQTTTAKQLKQDKTYDIRLYDGQGNLLRQKKTKGGAVQFNVASLPAGIYYLHIYDGVNGTPEMRQIVVER